MNVAREIVAGVAVLALFAVPSFAAADTQAPTAPSPAVVEAQGEVDGVKVTVRASSMLADPKQPNHYSPINLLDTDDSTVWAEGVPGNGEGQWVEFEVPASASLIAGFEFTPGHAKSPLLYAGNARPRLVQFTYFHQDAMLGTFEVEIPLGAPAGSWIVNWEMLDGIRTFPDRIRATIKSVWPGTHAKDLCVARFRPIFAGTLDGLTGAKEPTHEPDLGPSIVAMMGGLHDPLTYLATDGVVTLNEFAAWSADGTPTGPPEHATKMKGDRGDPYEWSCSGLAETSSWDKSGRDYHGFVLVVTDPRLGGRITSFLTPRANHSKRRPLRAHWELTPKGWKVRSLDVQPLTDEDEQECN